MSTSLNSTESNFLKRGANSIQTAKTKPNFLSKLTPFGYDIPKLEEGENLAQVAQSFYDQNKTEETESRMAKTVLEDRWDLLLVNFRRHKELFRRLFKNEAHYVVEMQIHEATPKRMNDFILYATAFYSKLAANEALLTRTALIGLTAEAVADSLALIDEVNKAQENVTYEKGQSQAATKTKNSAIHALKEWMDDFDNAAHMAFYDNPQELESLGIFVRS